jgi:hypothetical protein
MGEREKPRDKKHDEIIAAFDRERDEAHELHRRHTETMINSHKNDRPARRNDHDRHR